MYVCLFHCPLKNTAVSYQTFFFFYVTRFLIDAFTVGLFSFPVCLSVATVWQHLCPLNSAGFKCCQHWCLTAQGLHESINAERSKSCTQTTCWLKLEKNLILVHKLQKNLLGILQFTIICVSSCFSFYGSSIKILCPSCFFSLMSHWYLLGCMLIFPLFIQMTMLVINSIFCHYQQIP